MIYIIIPVFNRKELTRKCIESLLNQTIKEKFIIIVDDGSTDGTKEMLNNYPDIVRLEGNGNLWWAGATNLGILFALNKNNLDKNNFILILNNDLEVELNYLQTLREAYEINKPCLVGSICIDFENKNRIEDMGCNWNKYTAKFTNFTNIYGSNYKNIISIFNYIESSMLSGRGVLIPFKVFQKIGMFDNKVFPQYAADNDFSIRANKAGYKLLVSIKSPVYAHLKETGDDFKRNITYTTFIKSLFSIRSSTNIKTRYYFAIKHSPIKFLYFLIDMVRIFISFHILFLKKHLRHEI